MGVLHVRLLELRANRPGFKTVTFNPKGLSLIVGSKSKPDDKDRKKTYNGVGKSLIVALIHFCLGSNKKADLEKKLPGWIFELDISVDDQKYTITREAVKQNQVFLNEKKLTVKTLKKRLGDLAFDLPQNVPHLSFRSLVSRFIRPSRASYTAFDKFIPKENMRPHTVLLNNAFLLGYDPFLINRKADLKGSMDETRKNKKRLLEDPVTKEFFEAGAAQPLHIEIFGLKEKITELEGNLAAFKIANDFQQRQDEAQNVKDQLTALTNRIVVLRNALENIQHSMSIKDDIPIDRVKDLYEEAGLFFSNQQLKTLGDVAHFHKSLVSRRRERLLSEKQRLEQELDDIQSRRQEQQILLDRLMAYLGEHGALDDYALLSSTLADYRTHLERLQSHEKLLRTYDNHIAETKRAMEEENLRASNYLEEFRPIEERNLATFRSLSKELYRNKPGGITVENNVGENKNRYTMNVRIEDDRSDGINEAKIFCFDATLLLESHHHRVKFLFHDSRLFSEIDPRQRATIFREAAKMTRERNLQYIASLNEDMLESMRPYLSAEENGELERSIVLRLTDESPETKLLGMDIDLDYD